MSQKQTFIHDSVIEEFTPTCRHCKKTADEHADGTEEAAGSCLFDSTTWDPMSSEEWEAWRRAQWLVVADVGTNYIREQLKNDGFARRIFQVEQKKGDGP